LMLLLERRAVMEAIGMLWGLVNDRRKIKPVAMAQPEDA
jgi:hypothetical protein